MKKEFAIVPMGATVELLLGQQVSAEASAGGIDSRSHHV
jgi:hypothetical protein